MFNPNEPRDEQGRWTDFEGSAAIKEAASDKKSILNQQKDLKGDPKEIWMNMPNEISNAFPDSKVKDLVYHGSKSDFSDFDESKIASNDLGVFSKGIYFTTDRTYAAQYAGNNYSLIKPFEVNIKHPYEVHVNNDKSMNEARQLLSGKEIPKEFDGVIVYENKKMKEVVVRNKIQIKRVATDDDIYDAYDNGKYQKAIAEKRMSKNDAITIIKSVGLKVPNDF